MTKPVDMSLIGRSEQAGISYDIQVDSFWAKTGPTDDLKPVWAMTDAIREAGGFPVGGIGGVPGMGSRRTFAFRDVRARTPWDAGAWALQQVGVAAMNAGIHELLPINVQITPATKHRNADFRALEDD